MGGNSRRTGPDVRFPPPLVFLGFAFLGLALDDIAGLPPIPMGPELEWVGGAMIAAGIAVMIVSIGLFRAAGENLEPWTETRAVLARGPYRHSRNPMYLAMAAIHLGIALWLYSPGVLLFLPIAVLVIDRQVIAREEDYLRQRFGKPYNDYCRRVRRWF